MNAHDTLSETDYTYYPLIYPHMAFSTLATVSYFPENNYWATWLIPKDNSKFLVGIGANYIGFESYTLKIISVGF